MQTIPTGIIDSRFKRAARFAEDAPASSCCRVKAGVVAGMTTKFNNKNNYFIADSSLGISSAFNFVPFKGFCPNNTLIKLNRLINNS